MAREKCISWRRKTRKQEGTSQRENNCLLSPRVSKQCCLLQCGCSEQNETFILSLESPKRYRYQRCEVWSVDSWFNYESKTLLHIKIRQDLRILSEFWLDHAGWIEIFKFKESEYPHSMSWVRSSSTSCVHQAQVSHSLSSVNRFWAGENSRLHVGTLLSILIVRCNMKSSFPNT